MRLGSNLLKLVLGAAVLLTGCTSTSERELDKAHLERNAWEFEMTADNQGHIPDAIRKREWQFAQKLPKALPAARSAAEEIKPVGPFNIGGRTRALGIDVANASVLLAGGVSGSVWKSEDGGLSWNITSDLNSVFAISCIEQDRRSGKTNTWYYGTGEGEGNSASSHFAAIHYGNGVFKSTDNGDTWTPLTSTQSNTLHEFNNWDVVWRIATDPSNTIEDEVYAARAASIMRSTDGGSTWTRVLGSDGGSYFNMQHTDVIVTETGIVYAALGSNGQDGGVWRSEDGINWTKILSSGFPATYRRMVLDYAPSNEDVVYVFANTPGTGVIADPVDPGSEWSSFWKYTYVSGDGSGTGGQWENRSLNLPSNQDPYLTTDCSGGYNMTVRVHPGNEDIVFVGGTNLFRSMDGFATNQQIKQIGGYNPEFTGGNTYRYPNHHPDQQELVFHPSNSSKLFSAHDGGVNSTSNCLSSTVTWQIHNYGYQTTQFYTVAIDQVTENDVIIGGMQDNGCAWSSSNNAFIDWIPTSASDGAFTSVESQTGSNGAGYYYFSSQFGVVYRYELDDNGNIQGFRRVSPDSDVNGFDFVNPFATDINDADVLYMAAANNVIRHTDIRSIPLDNSTGAYDQGWSQLGINIGGGSSHRITSMAVSQGNPKHTLVVGTNDGKLYRMENANTGFGGASDISISNLNAGRYVSSIAIHPYDGSKMLVTTSNYNTYSIFFTDDNGDNWSRVAGNLEEPLPVGVPSQLLGIGAGPSIRSSAIIPLDGGETVYLVGTTIGLYATTLLEDTNTIWYQQSADALGNAVVQSMMSRASDGFLAIGTHGSGVFSMRFNDLAQVTGIEHEAESKTLRIYPNPTKGKFRLSDHKGAVEIYDMAGRVVKSYPESHKGSFDLSGLSGRFIVRTLVSGEEHAATVVVN